jgi:glyoxylase-like metal-dependent hydrolase (beta-lactamase superfamily II)
LGRVKTVKSNAGSDPIRSVAVLTTGTVSIHPQHAFGSRLPASVWLLGSRRWLPPRPINVFAIEHANGLVLFDTGQDLESIRRRDYLPTGIVSIVYRRLARFRLNQHESLASGLTALGYDVSTVRKAVLSHLHVDHIGGIRILKHAEMIVSEQEWTDLAAPWAELRGILRRHIDIPGIRWSRIQFNRSSELNPFTSSYDLMGDGSMLLLPTPGHTRGSLSLLLRRSWGAPLLMVGDLTFGIDLVERGRLPGLGTRGLLLDSTARVRGLHARLPELTVLAAHDPSAADLLRGSVEHLGAVR